MKLLGLEHVCCMLPVCVVRRVICSSVPPKRRTVEKLLKSKKVLHGERSEKFVLPRLHARLRVQDRFFLHYLPHKKNTGVITTVTKLHMLYNNHDNEICLHSVMSCCSLYLFICILES